MTAYDQWRGNGFTNNKALADALAAVGADDTRIGNDLQTGSSTQADGVTLAGDLGLLQGAAVVIKGDMPPSCIPNLDTDYGNALDAIQKMAAANTLLLGALNQGDTTAGNADIAVLDAYMSQADNSMVAATNDVTAFTGG
jgi:hypothetical protein